MNDLGERITSLASLLLKILIVLCVVRAILYALGVGVDWDIPFLDKFISFVASVFKTLSEGFFKLIDKHFSFA